MIGFFLWHRPPGSKDKEETEKIMKQKICIVLLALIPHLLFPISEEQYQTEYRTKVVPYYESGYFSHFPGKDGVRINYVIFEAAEEKGAIVILNGIPESYLKYAELAYDLRGLRYSLYLMDYRGVGFSGRMLEDPEKSHVERFSDYVADLRIFMDTVVNKREHKKLFLLGHSTGGTIGALYLADHQDQFDGAIFTSPLFQVNSGSIPGWIARPLLSIMVAFGGGENYAPGQGAKQVKTFEGNPLTHSRARWSMWEEYLIPQNPEIRSAGYSLRWAKESFRGAAKALKIAGKISIPVLLLEAEYDEFTMPRGREIFSKRAKNCKRIMFPGSKHEILIESDEIRNRVLEEIISFLEAHQNIHGGTAGPGAGRYRGGDGPADHGPLHGGASRAEMSTIRFFREKLSSISSIYPPPLIYLSFFFIDISPDRKNNDEIESIAGDFQ